MRPASVVEFSNAARLFVGEKIDSTGEGIAFGGRDQRPSLQRPYRLEGPPDAQPQPWQGARPSQTKARLMTP